MKLKNTEYNPQWGYALRASAMRKESFSLTYNILVLNPKLSQKQIQMAQSQSKNLFLNKKNPIAKSLKNRRYKQTIINSKKLYNRKEKKNETIKEFQSGGTN